MSAPDFRESLLRRQDVEDVLGRLRDEVQKHIMVSRSEAILVIEAIDACARLVHEMPDHQGVNPC